VAIAGQLITIAFAAQVLGVELALRPLFSIMGFTAATNVAFAIWLRGHVGRHETEQDASRDQRVLAAVMTLDLLALTGLLYFTGGPGNPFVLFYLLNVSLAAMVLPARWAWWLTLVANVCLLGLFVDHVELPELEQRVELPLRLAWLPTERQIGFVVSMVACGAVAVYFITRVTRELQLRDEQLRRAESLHARSERLEALATLAAGAGHELASPLSTIAVIAKDLSRQLEGTNVPATVIEDVQLIRTELDHCRRILNEMSSGAGSAVGETIQPVSLGRLIDETLSGLRRQSRVRVAFDPGVAERDIVLPLVATAQAIRGVVRNALDASPPNASVDVFVSERQGRAEIRVVDHGSGMSPDILQRAGEPFFTTKEPGKGMGLGLFLANNVVSRLGGEFELDSASGRGTTATIRLPS